MGTRPCSSALHSCRLFSIAIAFSSVAFATAQEVPFRRVHEMVPGSGSFFFRAGDVDGDGDFDVLVPYLSSQELYLWENKDHGRFEPRLLVDDFGSSLLLDFVELNGDGLADLVTYDSPGRIGIWINAGNGAFPARTHELRPPSQTPFGPVAIGDLDHDGDHDLYAAGGLSGAEDTLFFNDGTGAFPTKTSISAAETALIKPADFDGDGDLDVLRLESRPGYTYRVEVWINDGMGFLSAAPTQPSVPAQLSLAFVAAVDLNSDSRTDIVAGNPPHLYLNRAEGRFIDIGEILPKLVSNGTLDFVNLDGDERPDAVAYVESLQRHVLFMNRGEGGFEASQTELLPKHGQFNVVVDVDGDRDEDLLGSGPGLWLNDGRGNFTAAGRDAWETNVESHSVAAGDLDGNGFPDVFASGFVPEEAYIYLNRGNGEFLEKRLPFGVSRSLYQPLLVDVDGDLDLDVFGNGPTLLENNGHGEFVEVSNRLPALPNPFPVGLAAGDLDGDGDSDLLVTQSPGQVFLWLNDGTGNFVSLPQNLPTPTVLGRIALGDIDNDLDLDVWIASPRYGNDLLWKNDGKASFTDCSANLPPSSNDNATMADIDGDGDRDLLAASFGPFFYYGGEGYLFLNDGTGKFTDASYLWETIVTTMGGPISSADFDEDGDLDVIGPICGYWVNDGQGLLEEETYEFPYCSSSFESVALADFDLDGDLDVWYPGVPRPVMNTTRHLSWRSYPRVAKPLTMEMFGPPNTPWKLFAAGDLIAPEKTDFGFLRLPARGLRFVGSGNLDGAGYSVFTLSTPSDRALPGTTVYWQALVGDPPQLTNLELTTFRDL